MGEKTLSHVNAMPAPTWHWLKINDVSVDLPADLSPAGADAVRIEAVAGSEHVLSHDTDAFDTVMRLMDNKYAGRARVSAPGDARALSQLEAGELNTLDVPALSAYQREAVRTQETLSCSEAFLTGCGEAVYAYVRAAATDPLVIDVPSGEAAQLTLSITGTLGHMAAAALDVIVRAHARLDLALSFNATASGSLPDERGLLGTALRVFAGEGAHVVLKSYQTCDDAYTIIDDTGIFADEGACVHVAHTVLGAGKSLTGLAGDLRGDAARIDVKTSYLAQGVQQRDFNYQIRHLGKKTFSNMDANGVLAGRSKKVLRGTIDLMHGAKGAEGSERETVLLVDEGVDNKTVPVILCDEDDVAGNHGATIGHVRPEQLFYLGCRGLSQDDAESLFVAAKLEEAAACAPDEHIRAHVLRLAHTAAPQLAEDMEEEIA